MYLKLKHFMLENSIKNKDLAVVLKISEASVSKKLNVKNSNFNVNEIKKLCHYYNLDANIYFFSE